MSRSKDKGTAFERQVVEYLQKALGPAIERRALSGANDRGDVSGVYFMGEPFVLECKNCRRMELAEWMDEADTEAGNADAHFFAVVHKRRGCGDASFGDTYVTMPLSVFERMLSLAVEFDRYVDEVIA